MTLYCAGPMRGKPLYNFQSFFRAAMKLRKAGHIVFNPAERDMAQGMDPTLPLDHPHNVEVFSLAEAFEWDLARVAEADGIVLLAGWRQSKGTQVELATAITMGKRTFAYNDTYHSLQEIYFHEFNTSFIQGKRKPEKDGWNKPKGVSSAEFEGAKAAICGEVAKPLHRTSGVLRGTGKVRHDSLETLKQYNKDNPHDPIKRTDPDGRTF